ncbi:azurin [Luteimonas dalianensis]|uniref:azurin n=1 Tax=Luteimonas dalianensis TaxID=1148196 RepID=UPI003BF3150B
MKRYFAIFGLVLLGAVGTAQAQNCTISLEGNDRMQFNEKAVSVSASCPSITVELKHTGSLPVAAMGHNVVISETADVADVAQAGIKAGAPQYLPEGDARVIAATDMIGGGQTTSITFPGSKLTAGGDYTFFCSFPGHSGIMRGKVEVTN